MNEIKAYSYVGRVRKAKDVNSKREEYVKYFTQMQKQNNEQELSRMVWHWVQSAVAESIKIDKCFTREELSEMFPDFLSYLNN